jgi:hypothetical protein
LSRIAVVRQRMLSVMSMTRPRSTPGEWAECGGM